MTDESPDFNPFASQTALRPQLRKLRESAPVHHLEALGMYVVTGHDEVSAAVKHRSGEYRFTEFQTMRIGHLRDDPAAEPYCSGASQFLLMKGGEEHRRIRETFKRHFTNQRVAEMQDTILATAHDLIDGFAEEGSVDLRARFATLLPLYAISDVLGVPRDDHEIVERLVKGFKVAIAFPPMDEAELAYANESIIGLNEYFAGLVAQRRAEPRDDLLTLMVRDCDDGALSEQELISNAWGLYAGGHDTTAIAICNIVIALLEHPDQLALLMADPSLVSSAVDELMRFDGPAGVTHRLFSEPVEVGGTVIPADTPALIYFGSANRDERWCPHAETLDINREAMPGGDLSYSSGPHVCPGRHLARATMRAALSTLFARLHGLRIAELEWDLESFAFHTPSEFVLAWDSASPRPDSAAPATRTDQGTMS